MNKSGRISQNYKCTCGYGDPHSKWKAMAEELVKAASAVLRFEGHMTWCGHGIDDKRPCVCGYVDAQNTLHATLAKFQAMKDDNYDRKIK